MKKRYTVITILLCIAFLAGCQEAANGGSAMSSNNEIQSFMLETSIEFSETILDKSSGDTAALESNGNQISQDITHISDENVGQSIQVQDVDSEKEEIPSLPDGQGSEESSISNAEEIKDTRYSILTYTEAPNENSSISIQYPFFEGEGKETLNNIIFGKVQEFAQIDGSLFPEDSSLTVDYQAEITLQNAKMVSIVFWGTSSISGSAYGTNDIIPFNIDIQTMKEITFEDLYVANEDFQKIFFEKAYFPTNPITSYDEASFAEMLKLQSPEYQSISPFSISGNVHCFLKPNALVLSMPSVHASGNDHFEAQINYDDIEGFYLLEQKYWD